MNMNGRGVKLVCEFEGFRAAAYRDPVGVLTVGYGHTGRAGPPAVAAGMRVTRVEARRILVRDLARFAAGVRTSLRVTLNDNQFSALVSFAYNVGLPAFRKSSVLAAVNRGAFASIPRRLALWVNAGGTVLPGLVRRRAAEAALFMEPVGEVEPVREVEPEVARARSRRSRERVSAAAPPTSPRWFRRPSRHAHPHRRRSARGSVPTWPPAFLAWRPPSSSSRRCGSFANGASSRRARAFDVGDPRLPVHASGGCGVGPTRKRLRAFS